MATRSTASSPKKPSQSRAKTAVTKPAVRPAKRLKSASVSSKTLQPSYSFLAGAVVIAAILVFLSIFMAMGQKTASPAVVGIRQPELYVTADAKALKPGADFAVDLYESSGNEQVNAIQAAVTYTADKLKLTSIDSVPAFSLEAATDTSSAGLIRVARAVPAGGQPLVGRHRFATAHFSVLPSSKGNVGFSIDPKQSLIVRSSDNQNILQLTPSASFTIQQ